VAQRNEFKHSEYRDGTDSFKIKMWAIKADKSCTPEVAPTKGVRCGPARPSVNESLFLHEIGLFFYHTSYVSENLLYLCVCH